MAAPRWVRAHGPSWAMPDDVVFLVLAHSLVGHAGKVVVALVVLAHVIEAEAVILALMAAALGRRIESGFPATCPFAMGAGVAQQPVPVRLDAEAVEKLGVELHYRPIMGSAVDQDKRGRLAQIRLF